MVIEAMIIIFILGYTCIALEHKINIDKAAIALLMCGVLWSILSIWSTSINPDITPQ